MYVAVHHIISDPAAFWGTAGGSLASLPANLKLHHSFPVKDGSQAVCIWEADSVEALRDYLEPLVGSASENEYLQVENKEGVTLPSAFQAA